MCQIEGCLVVLDGYQIYYHPSKACPDGLISPTDNKNSTNTTNESSVIYKYIDSPDSKTIDLKFNKNINNKKKKKNKHWKMIYKKHENMTICIIYSIPMSIYYYTADTQWIWTEFEEKVFFLVDRFFAEIPKSFSLYEEDYDADDDESINEMPLYILSLRCKTIFVKLFSTFSRKSCWLNFKHCCQCKLFKMKQEFKRKRQIIASDINERLRRAEREERRVKKLLLIGGAGAGKAAIFKQLRLIHSEYSEQDRLQFKEQISMQVIEQMRLCLKAIEMLKQKDVDEYKGIELSQDKARDKGSGTEAAKELQNLKSMELTLSVANVIETLWKENAVRLVYNERARLFRFIEDSNQYFFDEIQRISRQDYVPTDRDILMVRCRSTGILEKSYEVRGNEFHLINVCAQRNDRRHWIHMFEKNHAILFVVSLSSYNEVLLEDETKNAMHEEIELFTEFCNSKWFRKQEFILLLNKDDIFREKIKSQISLSTCFSRDVGWQGKQWEGPDYKPISGDDGADRQHYDECYEAAIQFIQDAFIEVNPINYRVIFCHVICAIDHDSVEKMFWDIQNILIRSNLKRGGLMCGGSGFSGPSIKMPSIKMPKIKFGRREKEPLYELDAETDAGLMELGFAADLEISPDFEPTAPAVDSTEIIATSFQKIEEEDHIFKDKQQEVELFELETKAEILPEEEPPMFDEEDIDKEKLELLEEKEEEEDDALKQELVIQQEMEAFKKKKKRKESKFKSQINKLKRKISEWRAARKLIDNVFADLENIFYLLAQLLLMIELTSLNNQERKCKIICMNLMKAVITPFTYLLVIIVAIFVILPSCFFLLIVRMSKVETTSKYVGIREAALILETKCQRFMRVINQLLRSSFMFIFLVIYPIIIIYVIIPFYENNDNVIIWFISSYLFIILLLQLFGTWRGIKSFEERKKLKPNEDRYIPQNFKLNLGSILAILLLFYEVFQLSIFAYQTTTDGQQIDVTQSEETSFSADSLSFIDSKKIIKFTNYLVRVCYLSLDFVEDNQLEYYTYFSIVGVGLLVLFFVYRFIYELKIYAKLKWKENKATEAREVYFHSFVGTIIYGHGKLKHVNKWNAKIISLLADSFFLGICQKIVLILSCDNNQFLRIDPSRKCWESEHKLYSCIALILLGFYIPICSMVAPMFQEDFEFDEKEEEEEDDKEEDKAKKKCFCCKKKEKVENKEEEQSAFKQFASFTNTIAYVAPYMSAFTVMQCFMLISSEFVSKGGEYGTIISQSISMIGLLWFTISWSFNDLNKYGLTQNEPAFPFGISIIKILALFCGFIGCILEILRFNLIIDVVLELFLLFLLIIIISIVFGFIFLKYHSFFNDLDDNVDVNIMIKFNANNNTLQLIDNNTVNIDKEPKQLLLSQENNDEMIIPWSSDNFITAQTNIESDKLI